MSQGLYGVALAYVVCITACSISISCRSNSDADADADVLDPIAWVREMAGPDNAALWRIDRVEKGSVMAYSRSSITSLCSNKLSPKWRHLLVQQPSQPPTFSPCAPLNLPNDVDFNPAQTAAIALCMAAQDYCLVLHPSTHFIK